MVHGHEKSDLAIVAVKPANKVASPVVEQSTMGPAAAESVERRVGTKGNADCSKLWIVLSENHIRTY